MKANPRSRVWASVARAWWRARPRRAAWSLVLLGIVAGATAGVSLAALDGARRTGSVIERSSAATKEPDVLIAPDRPDFDWSPIERLPEIEAIGLFGGPVCALDVGKGALCGEVIDNASGRDISTGYVAVGREPDRDRADEVVVNRSAAVHYHLAVGDTFTMVSPTPAQVREAFRTFRFPEPSEFAGPKVKVHVVAIAAPSLTDRLLGDVDSVDTAEFYATQAYADLQPGAFPDGGFVVNAMARLKPGTDVDRRSVVTSERPPATRPSSGARPRAGQGALRPHAPDRADRADLARGRVGARRCRADRPGADAVGEDVGNRRRHADGLGRIARGRGRCRGRALRPHRRNGDRDRGRRRGRGVDPVPDRHRARARARHRRASRPARALARARCPGARARRLHRPRGPRRGSSTARTV